MSLLDEALALAVTFAPTEAAGADSRLMALCKTAEAELAASLRDGVTEDDCRDAMVCAIAWLALSYLCAGRSTQTERFSVGDLSVEQSASGGPAVECLRNQAKLLMAPYVKEADFGFRGVRV